MIATVSVFHHPGETHSQTLAYRIRIGLEASEARLQTMTHTNPLVMCDLSDIGLSDYDKEITGILMLPLFS